MRHILTVIIIVFLLLALSFFSGRFISKSFTSVADRISTVSTLQELKSIAEDWEKISSTAELFMDHSELEDFSRLLWEMEAELSADKDEFEESRNAAKEMLLHLAKRYRFSLTNLL